MLNHIQIIASPSNDNSVSLGHKVKIEKTTPEGTVTIHEYIIVGTTEAAPLENKISNESPIGKALLGLGLGQETTCETLNG
jgi:transcription elongation factor GreA